MERLPKCLYEPVKVSNLGRGGTKYGNTSVSYVILPTCDIIQAQKVLGLGSEAIDASVSVVHHHHQKKCDPERRHGTQDHDLHTVCTHTNRAVQKTVRAVHLKLMKNE